MGNSKATELSLLNFIGALWIGLGLVGLASAAQIVARLSGVQPTAAGTGIYLIATYAVLPTLIVFGTCATLGGIKLLQGNPVARTALEAICWGMFAVLGGLAWLQGNWWVEGHDGRDIFLLLGSGVLLSVAVVSIMRTKRFGRQIAERARHRTSKNTEAR